MTFSQQVKIELLSREIKPQSRLTSLLAIFDTLAQNQGEKQITITSSIKELIIFVEQILQEDFPEIDCAIQVSNKRNGLSKRPSYKLILSGVDNLKSQLAHQSKMLVDIEPKLTDSDKFTKYDEQIKIYTRFCFIASGSVNTPDKERQYHLEIKLRSKVKEGIIISGVKNYGINLKRTSRKYYDSLYLNRSDEIGDFLNFIGSKQMLFVFEDQRILRDLYLNSNRINNADIANTLKSVNAAEQQLDAINKLIKTNQFQALGPKTKAVAKLRLDNPEASLNELAQLSDNEFSKSNISYHLRLITTKGHK